VLEVVLEVVLTVLEVVLCAHPVSTSDDSVLHDALAIVSQKVGPTPSFSVSHPE